MASSLGQVLTLIVGSLGSLFILAVLLRFLLQASRADFYNPVSQAIVKATSPVLNPLRKIIPGYGGIDFAALVLALLLNIIATTIMILAAGYSLPNIGTIVGWSCIGLVAFILNIYFYGLIISIVSSWIAPYSGNPILLLVQQLLEPIQSRVIAGTAITRTNSIPSTKNNSSDGRARFLTNNYFSRHSGA